METFPTGPLSPVLGKLVSLLGNEYTRFKGVRREVQFLMDELTYMNAYLENMSKEEVTDVQDAAWMKKVREMSYDIEDSLDDFMIRVDGRSAKPPDGFIKKIKVLLEKTMDRRRIAKAIQDLKAQVKEAGDRRARYKHRSVPMTIPSPTVDQRSLAIFKDVSELVGTDGPKREVIELLNGDAPQHQPKVVSIVGPGGLGKTTIARQVFQELKGRYKYVSFVTLSRNPDFEKILRTILSEVTGKDYYETEAGSKEKLIEKIEEFLKDKRYLVVIDDVWDTEAWKTIWCAFSRNSYGSSIVTTTRKHDVADVAKSFGGSVYELKPLSRDNSKRLFSNRIFGPREECPSNLETVSDQILTKCDGLPLAIIAISGLLANKARNGVHSTEEWEKVETSIGHGLERDSSVKGMIAILSLSYYDLPYYLKDCLLYLSMFPEDHLIDKCSLVRRWVAEGFIPAEPTYTLYELGEVCFIELINRNLIIPYQKGDLSGGDIDEVYGVVDSCVVHDTILDFIVSKSIEDNFITINGVPRVTPPAGKNKVRRITLQEDETLLPNKSYSNVRSLITFGSFIGSPCSFLDFKFLRVLDLKNCASLENHHLTNIKELVHLRYLSLGTAITELPEQIGELEYLETLDLQDCPISKLPATIVGLKKLFSLLVGDTLGVSDVEPPDGIRSMQALEELVTLCVDTKKQLSFLEEIGELTKMRKLNIQFLHLLEMDDIKKMVSSVRQLNNLQYFNAASYEFVDSYLVLPEEEPWYHASIRCLVFTVCTMLRIPSWMKSLVKLQKLELLIKEFDQESLDILGGLPILVELKIKILVTEVGEDRPAADEQRLLVSRRCAYASLSYLKITGRLDRCAIYRMSIPMLMFEKGSMPVLEELYIDIYADITVSGLNFGLEHLSHLTKLWCRIYGNGLIARFTEHAIRESLKINSNACSVYVCCMALDNQFRLTAGDEPRSDSASDTDNGSTSTAALPLPKDLTFSGGNLQHPKACPSPNRKLGSSSGQRYRRKHQLKPCQGQSQPTLGVAATISQLEVGHEACDGKVEVERTSGAPTSDSCPQLADTAQPPVCFTFCAGATAQPPALYRPWRQLGLPAAPSQAPPPSLQDLNSLCGALSELSVKKSDGNDIGT